MGLNYDFALEKSASQILFTEKGTTVYKVQGSNLRDKVSPYSLEILENWRF